MDKTLMKDKANVPVEMAKAENFNFGISPTHAKITLVKTATKYIVIQGSGNYSTNPKIEQYTILKDKATYDFYKEIFRGQEWLNGADQKSTQMK